MAGWWEDLAGLDTETTGRDPLTARLVTASMVRVVDEIEFTRDWLVAVEDPIPAEATAVHGVTTERAQAEGRPLAEVLPEIVDELDKRWDEGVPVVVYNAPYDLTLLNQERDRCRHAILAYNEVGTPILDPLVLDRGLDKYRKGSRKLDAVCQHYGVVLENAHTSSADALAAVKVMVKLVERFPQLQRMSLQELYRSQVVWYAQWAENYQQYLRRKATNEGATWAQAEEITVDASWPVRVAPAAAPAAPR